ncbi:MAG: aldehyde ferredoxin oxidoreductase family protein [Candidatus Bathyarchaeia archaeon]
METSFFAKKALFINLTKKEFRIQEIPKEWFKLYIGGIGFGIKIIFDKLNPKIDPYSPDNTLVFSIGPLTGTPTPMFAQTCVVTKSPLTNGVFNSYAGGTFGFKMKLSDYSIIAISGKSNKPCYVKIQEDFVEFLDASALWGMSTSKTQEAIMKDIGNKKLAIACIGPAGENLVRFASIITEKRAFGRGGYGAVMGSKNLKAIALIGKDKEETYDENFIKAVNEAKETLKKALSSEWHLIRIFSNYGTLGGLPLVNEKGVLATRNHKEGQFEGAEKIGPEYFKSKLRIKDVSCPACLVHCGRVYGVKEGIYFGTISEGPEYETVYAFGSNCGNDYAESIVKADYLCDEYGMDTLSTGVTIAFAMECYEKGILTKKETEGIELKFGNHEAIIDTIEKIVKRKGIGNILAEGCRIASEKLGKGSKEFAMQVKGLEFAAWMPTGMKGIALTFATSNRGACHKRAIIGDELMDKVSKEAYEGKALLVKNIQDKVNAIFTLIACRFSEFVYPLSLYVKLLNSLTGLSFNEEEFLKVGERIWNLERLFSGFTRKDDTLPERCFKEAIPSGPSKGQKVEKEKFEKMIEEYYLLRGWNKKGIPSKEKLQELGIFLDRNS